MSAHDCHAKGCTIPGTSWQVPVLRELDAGGKSVSAAQAYEIYSRYSEVLPQHLRGELWELCGVTVRESREHPR
jgi:hypothetical protein